MPSLEEAKLVSCAFGLEDVVAFIKNHRDTLRRLTISEYNFLGEDSSAAETKIKEQLALEDEGHDVHLVVQDLEDMIM